MQVLGTRSIADAKLAARKFARMIKKLGFNVRLDGFNVQNIVANCDTKMKIRLEGLVLKHRALANYEPEQFPGLVYRLQRPKVTALIFAKGKVVLLGAKKLQEHEEAIALLYPALQEFRIAD